MSRIKGAKQELTMQLIGTPEIIIPHIKRITKTLTIDDVKYKAEEKPGRTSEYSKQLYVLCGTEVDTLVVDLCSPYPDKHEIINFTLQSLPNNKTILMIQNVKTDFNNADNYIDYYIKQLLSEMKELGFIEAWYKKTYRIIKELIGIAQVTKP